MAGCVLLSRGLILILVFHQVGSSVFLSASRANGVLARWKRAGSYVLEELLEGNLERECYEEICVHEEAREVFEDDAVTDEFWRYYRGGSPCLSQPCLNNGSCQDNIRSYTCTCSPGYEGRNCAVARNQCYPERTDGCQHFCHPGQASYMCSCAKGHRLREDQRSCTPSGQRLGCEFVVAPAEIPHWHGRLIFSLCCTTNEEKCACGVLASKGTGPPESSRQQAPSFPWQVQLTNSRGEDFCGGVLIQENFVLATASCSQLHTGIRVRTDFGRADEGLLVGIKSTRVHMWYDAESGENDLALLELEWPVQCPGMGLPICIPERDFAEHVLIPGTGGLLSGWILNGTRLGNTPTRLPVTHVDGEECGQVLNVTITTRTGCERARVAAGRWVGGSAVAREHRGTWFLTGILGSPPPGEQALTFLLTKVARYSLWFKQVMGD